MDRVTFSVNGNKCSVGPEVDSDVHLLEYLREYLELRGTKYMCKEGGCGSCIVAVTTRDPNSGHPRTFSVNSCLILITQCQDWNITTIEGIGNRRIGYHPIQSALAEHNGTQCGFCSPGWVMSLYSLLESRNYTISAYEIEDSLGSNSCRCTGYRPILEAFKSFAKDVHNDKTCDIEDITVCQNKCNTPCSKKVKSITNCQDIDSMKTLNEDEIDQNKEIQTSSDESDQINSDKSQAVNDTNKSDEPNIEKEYFFTEPEDGFKKNVIKIRLKDGRFFYRVTETNDIFKILDDEGDKSYMLIVGNTAKGAYPLLTIPKILIDINGVYDLKKTYLDINLVIGASTTLTDLMSLFLKISEENENFAYLKKFHEHLNLVAHIPVRNVGCIAGNLMLKHRLPYFSSDVFLLFESVGATMTIIDKTGSETEIRIEQFLHTDMTGKVILNVKLPPFPVYYKFVSFKIMPRSQNVHAQVNAALLFKFDKYDNELANSVTVVMGGISSTFVHAKETEKFLKGKRIFNNEILQRSLKILEEELIVDDIAGEMKPAFRKKLALGLFYKAHLTVINEMKLNPRYRSAVIDFRKSRPISKGIQVFDTNPIIWPINEPTPKVEALIQCAGEAKYVDDMSKQPQEVFAAFVTSDICRGSIVKIDPSPALSIPGVLQFFSAKDIPGSNSFLSPKVITMLAKEEILCSGEIKYYDQPIGIIVAESDQLARRAALLVKVIYKVNKDPPIIRIDQAREEDPSKVSLFFVIPERERGANTQKIIKGCDNIFWQYHYPMETLQAITRPSDDGIDLFPSTQWIDACHIVTADALKINENRINLSLARVGGSYGLKISRTCLLSAASALVTYLMNRPCRFVLSIQASLRIIGKRCPATREFEAGVDDKGQIQYMEYHFYEDNGYVFSDQVILPAITALRNCYNLKRWQVKCFNVTTDTASNTWARSPGTLEGISMAEILMEQITYEVDKDPFDVRFENLDPRDETVLEITRKLKESSEYEKRKQEVEHFNKLNRWKKRGLRVALMSWPASTVSDYHVLLSVHHGDGTVSIRHGGVEHGQGVNTRVIQVVAYTLNLPVDKIKIKPNDVVSNPNNLSTGDSRTSEIVCLGAVKCCQLLLDRLRPLSQTLNYPTWEALITAAYYQGINLQTSYQTTSNDIQNYTVAGAAVSEIELDLLTGEHNIIRVDIIEDVGTSMNPELDIGQIEGAFIMGVGYWTCEHIIYDELTGELLTDRTWTYNIPLAKDIPIDFRVELRRNSYNTLGVIGSRLVAEPPICLSISVPFAIRHAIVSSREDSGYPRTEWFHIEGPSTLEQILLAVKVRLEEFLYD